MHRGYVKIYRKLFDSVYWKVKPFDKGRAWVDLIMLANWEPGELDVRGIIVPVARGQVGWSKKLIAERWGWSEGKVTLFLKQLEDRAQISVQKNNITSIITIKNYDKYHGDEAQNGAESERRPSADCEQTAPKKKLIEVKEGKEVETGSDILPEMQRKWFNLFWIAWPKGKKKSKGAAERAWKKIAPDNKLFGVIIVGLNRARSSKEWAKDEGKYIPHPATWLNAKGWEDDYEPAKAGNNGDGARRPDALQRMKQAQKEEGQPL